MPDTSTSQRRRARRSTPATRAGVWAVAVAGAVSGAAVAGRGATAWPAADAALCGLLVGSVALAGSRARRWTLLWSCSIATLFTIGSAAVALPLAGTALAAYQRFLGRRNRVVGAVLGAVAALAALELSWPSWHGATAAVAAAVVAPPIVSGLRRAPRPVRRRVLVGVGVTSLTVVAATAAATVAGLDQRAQVDAALELVRDGTRQASEGRVQEASSSFTTAATTFAGTAETLQSWWMAPARATPVLGANLEFARVAADSGAELGAAAAELVPVVDAEELRSPDGGVDLAEIPALQPAVTRARDALERARGDIDDAGSSWLAPPLDGARRELLSEMADAGRTTEIAQLALERVPQLMGADGERRYLMLLGNPAELRDIGGHIGSWAELRAVDGRLELVEVGQPYELAGPWTTPPLQLTPGAYPESLLEMRPQYFPQNWGSSPDMPTVAAIAAELYEQVRPGAPVDGVAYADPSAFAALLRFTGPVAPPGGGAPLDAETAERYLVADQYGAATADRDPVLDELIEQALTEFGRTPLPTPAQLADAFGPVVRRGGLQFATFDPADDDLLDMVGLRGAVERPGSGDLLAVIVRNDNPSKIDTYLDRSTTYEVDWDPWTGRVEGELEVTLTNTAPPSGLPALVASSAEGLAPGTNNAALSVLTPWDVTSASVDGVRVEVLRTPELRGVDRVTLADPVALPPGGSRTVRLTVSGEVGAGAPYLLQWVGQPSVMEGSTEVTVRMRRDPDGSELTTTRTEVDARQDALLRHDVR